MNPPGRFGPILYVVGFLLVGLGGVMLVPALIDLSLNSPEWRTFITAAVTTVFLGGTLVLANRGMNSSWTSTRASC
jgi:trk system potassium uptake protein TrkH